MNRLRAADAKQTEIHGKVPLSYEKSLLDELFILHVLCNRKDWGFPIDVGMPTTLGMSMTKR